MSANLVTVALVSLLELKKAGVLKPLRAVPNGSVTAITCVDPRYDEVLKSALKVVVTNGGKFIPPITHPGGAIRLSVNEEMNTAYLEADTIHIGEVTELFHQKITVYLSVHGPDCKFCLLKGINFQQTLERLQKAQSHLHSRFYDYENVEFRTAIIMDETMSGGPITVHEANVSDALRLLEARKIQ